LIDFSPREHRGRINAIVGVSGGLLSSAGSLMGGVLYQEVSTEAPFFTASALLSAGAVYALLTLKEPREREE
ncbi:MFS transporter, partial [Candidatus Bathyarchaeota archaeon]